MNKNGSKRAFEKIEDIANRIILLLIIIWLDNKGTMWINAMIIIDVLLFLCYASIINVNKNADTKQCYFLSMHMVQSE